MFYAAKIVFFRLRFAPKRHKIIRGEVLDEKIITGQFLDDLDLSRQSPPELCRFPPNPKQLDKLFRQRELAIILENQDYEK